MKSILFINKEIIMYVIFGIFTTLVNIVSYAICSRLFILDIYMSNIIAWILSVLFAYITNRKYVFNSNVKTIKSLIKELLTFYTSRLFTFGIDMLLMYLLINIINIDDMISKIIVNVIIIILNYVLSKFIIFKRGVING